MASLLLVAHAPLASSLQAVAQHVYPDCFNRLAAVDVEAGATLEATEARIRAAQMRGEGGAQGASSVARRGRSEAVAELLRGRRPPLVAVQPQPGAFCHE